MVGSPAGNPKGTPAFAPDGESAGPVAVALIDDRTLFGQSLATAINASTPEFAVSHWTHAQVRDRLADILREADIVVVAIPRAGLRTGSAGLTLRRLLDEPPHPPVALLTDRAGRGLVKEAVELGVRGVLSYTLPLGAVVAALRRIHGGATVVPNPP